MKKLFIIPFLLIAVASFGQGKVKSKALADSIYLPKAAFEITPIIVTANGDTARSMMWFGTLISRDTTAAFNVTVSMFDKLGNTLTSVNQTVPGAVFTRWALFLNKIDAYILNQRKRLVKQ